MEATVTQSGSRVTITGSIDTNTFYWENTTGVISADGRYTPNNLTPTIPTCGLRTDHQLIMRFTNNTLETTESYTTTVCGLFRAEATLTKQ